jgi:hypothetical protein
VSGDLLRVLKRAAVLEVGGDPGRAEGVAADLRLDAGAFREPRRSPQCDLLIYETQTEDDGKPDGS